MNYTNEQIEDMQRHFGELKYQDYAALREKIKHYVEKWINNLGLAWWRVDVHYKNETVDKGNSQEQAATAHSSWEYRQCALTFNVPSFEQMPDEKIEQIVIHEMVHVLLNPMRMWWPDHMEQRELDQCMKMEEMATTNLDRAIKWTWEAGVREGRRLAALESEKKEA